MSTSVVASNAVIAEILPVLLLAPIAGTVADRLPRIGVMITADLWRTGLAALLPLASHHLAAVYVIAFGLSTGGVFFNPASAALFRETSRSSRSTLASRSPIAAACSAIAASRAAQPAQASAGGRLVTTRHDYDIRIVIKPTRWAASANLTTPRPVTPRQATPPSRTRAECLPCNVA